MHPAHHTSAHFNRHRDTPTAIFRNHHADKLERLPGIAPNYVDACPTDGSGWARQWQAAEKIVYSRTLAEPRSARTRIEREFDPDAIRRLKAGAEHDITVDGPELAAQAIRAGLVDEFQMIVCPVVVGGGKRFFPDGVRLNLELVEERRFGPTTGSAP